MGAADREYMQDDRRRSGFAGIGGWTVTNWIIAVCVAVFLLDKVLWQMGYGWIVVMPNGLGMQRPYLFNLGYFSVDTAIQRVQLWRFVTCQFLHGNLSHLLFNMMGLYFFGSLIETYLGRRRYVVFYLASGVGGCLMYLLLWKIRLLGYEPDTTLVGASAGIFGVLIATAVVAPNVTVLVSFIFPMKIRTAAVLVLVAAAYTVLSSGKAGTNNAGGEAAHLGGAIVGFLLIQRPSSIPAFRLPASWRRNSRPRL